MFKYKGFDYKTFFINYKINFILSSFIVLTWIFLYLGFNNAYYFLIISIGFVLGTFLLRDTKWNHPLYIFLISFFLGYICIVIVFSILEVFGIGELVFPLTLIISNLLVFLIIFSQKIFFIKLKFKESRIFLYLYAALFLSIFIKIGPIYNYENPILHDPIAHATWAKEILNSGQIKNFYSPGLHIVSAIGKYLGSWDVGRQVLLITNIFQSLVFIPAFFFILENFKDKRFAIITSLMFAIGTVPASFFWRSGKNSLLISIPLFFLLLFFCSLDYDKYKKFISINILLLSLILSHSPVAFVGVIFAFCILYFKNKQQVIKFFLPGVFLGVFWAFLKYPYEIARHQENITEIVYSPQLSLINKEEFLGFFQGLFENSYSQFSSSPFMQFIYFVGLLGLLLLFLKSSYSKRSLAFVSAIFLNIVSMFLFHFNIIPSALRIIYSTQQLFFFFSLIYIGFGFALSRLLPHFLRKTGLFLKILFSFLVFIIIYFMSLQIYTKNKDYQRDFNLVEDSDIQVFEWMNNNLPKGSGILINAFNPSNRKSVVFAGDSGAWLEVYTDFNITMPFSSFSSKTTHENFSIYSKLFENPESCSVIESLLEKNISYYYLGSRSPFSEQIIISEELIEKGLYEIIFEKGDSKLYMINGCL